MLSFEEARQALTEMADDLPAAIYKELNGGIILVQEEKLHPNSGETPLYIQGEYHHEPHGAGRYILLYYGSFLRSYGHLPGEELRLRLREVLHHELTHHVESLCGDRSLEKQDAIDLARYHEQ